MRDWLRKLFVRVRSSLSWMMLPSTRRDYESLAGDLLSNSVVSAAVWWVVRSFLEAPPAVTKTSSDGVTQYVPSHPLLELLHSPNPNMDYSALMGATLASTIVDGNAYWFLARAGRGRIAEVWFVPPLAVKSEIDDNGIVRRYTVSTSGGSVQVEPSDMVRFWLLPDRLQPEKGWQPLRAVLREIVADNEASTFSVSLLSNMGVPGLVVKPKSEAVSIDPDAAERIAQLAKQKVSGDRRGEALVLPEAVDIQQFGFNAQEVGLGQVRAVAASRICAALGIDPMVIGLPSEQKTYSNYQEAREAAFENLIVPLYRIFASQINRSSLKQFLRPGERFEFDLRNVRVLQPDLDKLAQRMDIGVRGGWVMVSEARAAIGLPVSEDDNVYLRNPNQLPVGEGSIGGYITEEGD